jgi:hypothetical protein
MKKKLCYISPDQEELIRKKYKKEVAVSFQYGLDCALADLFGQERPELGVKRMAESKIKPEEELSRSGLYKRKMRNG